MRNPGRWIGLCALVALATGPTLADDVVVRTFPFQAGDLLEIEVDGGDIEYETGGSGEIAVNVVAHRGEVSDYLDLYFDPKAGGLRIEGERRGGGLWSRMFGDGDTPITFRIQGPRTLDMVVSTAGGDIVLADVSGKIRLATSGGDIDFGEIDGELKAATSGGDIRGDFVSELGSAATSGGNIEVARAGGDLKVATSGGNIEVDDVQGKLTASTSGGNIRLGDIQGDLSARTSGGSIRIGSTGGAVNVSTSGGDIRIEATGGDARISTSGGDVLVRSAAGYVTASTSGGDLEVGLDSDEGAELKTSRGILIVHVPAGAGFDLDADAQGGRLRSDLPIEGSVGQDHAEGKLGGGGSLLRLRNRDGDIRIESR